VPDTADTNTAIYPDELCAPKRAMAFPSGCLRGEVHHRDTRPLHAEKETETDAHWPHPIEYGIWREG
jgi:hypothetical protein